MKRNENKSENPLQDLPQNQIPPITSNKETGIVPFPKNPITVWKNPFSLGQKSMSSSSAFNRVHGLNNWDNKEEDAQNLKQFIINLGKERDHALHKLLESLKNNQLLIHENNILKEGLDSLTNKMQVLKQEKKAAEEEKKKRKRGRKQILRASITPEEFIGTMELVKGNSYVPTRKRCALILLYLTGVRVSILLTLTVGNMKQLLEKKSTTIIKNLKKKKIRYRISLSPQGSEFLLTYLPNFTNLILNKNDDQPLFTTHKDFTKPINRVSFDQELNKILTEASLLFGKHIRTHTFRATFITELLESTPIDIVQEFIGHKDIKTTLHYKKESEKKESEKKESLDQRNWDFLLLNLDKGRKYIPNLNG